MESVIRLKEVTETGLFGEFKLIKNPNLFVLSLVEKYWQGHSFRFHLGRVFYAVFS